MSVYRCAICRAPMGEDPGAGPHRCPLRETRAPAPSSVNDPVNHPSHYTSHPSGVECIEITEHFNFCVGNAIKYLWRAGLKGDAVEDLKKARFYIDREIARLERRP